MEERKSFATFKDGHTEKIFYFEKCHNKVLFATESGVYIHRISPNPSGVYGIFSLTDFFKVNVTSDFHIALNFTEEFNIESITLDERLKVHFTIDGEKGEVLVNPHASENEIKLAILDSIDCYIDWPIKEE